MSSHKSCLSSKDFGRPMPPPDPTTPQDSQAKNDNGKGRDKSVCMALYRCAPQIASFSLRRTVGFKLAMLSIVSTFVVFSCYHYIASNYHHFLLPKVLTLNGVYNFESVPEIPGNFQSTTGEKRAPNVIIFGVSKCGTRAMLEYLKLHPSVVAASTEIDFFNDDSLYSRGPAWYIQQMPYSRKGQITVEKSPDYFQNPKCPWRIREFDKDMRLILLLRDPVERLISQYMQLMDKNPQLPPFGQWAVNPNTDLVNANVPSVRVSAYAEHLDGWLEAFPRSQIHIVESKSLRENPYPEMKRVESFLNLYDYFEPSDFYFNSTRGFYCLRNRATGRAKCLGKSKGRQHIPVASRIRQLLRAYYEPYNAKLSQILQYKFTWS